MNRAIFIRLMIEDVDEKSQALRQRLNALSHGEIAEETFSAPDHAFRLVPGSPFAYWITNSIRCLFTDMKLFSQKYAVKQGLATAYDFRFIRLAWEVPSKQIAIVQTDQFEIFDLTDRKRWVNFAKGGRYSKYYADLHLLVNWGNRGEEIKNRINPTYNRPYSNIWQLGTTEVKFFCRSGLTWPARTNGFSVRILPRNCIFSHKGHVAFVEDDNDQSILSLSGIMNSKLFQYLVTLQLARTELAQSYEVGLIRNTPVPDMLDNGLSALTRSAHDTQRQNYVYDETTHVFGLPALLAIRADTLVDSSVTLEEQAQSRFDRMASLQAEIDDIVFNLYDLGEQDRELIRAEMTDDTDASDDEDNDAVIPEDTPMRVHNLLMWLVGATLGRWDIRYATGEQPIPDLPDPFDPLPACPPGMLQGEDGLPLTVSPPGYPLDVVWDGILVDDEGHPDDIIGRVRSVLALLWDDPDAIEAEMLEVLGEKSLRGYFRKSSNSGFWMSHVKRYSKSRRKAPIYWYLQSSNGNYGLWLYYHRLSKDLYYQALEKYVRPKLALEQARAQRLRNDGESARVIAAQDDLVSEIHDFHDALERVAALALEPDLNDGVVLNIAPLHELIPWKEAAKYWKELVKGKYEWSTISGQLRERRIIK